MHFAIDYWAISILLFCSIILSLIKNRFFSYSAEPVFLFSRLKDLSHPSWRSQLASYLPILHLTAVICLMIAFIDPHFLLPKSSDLNKQQNTLSKVSDKGIAIYLVLDQSGSMAQSVMATGTHDARQSIPKIDLLKQVTKQFILDHPDDLMGLVSFARVPKVLVPLTLDQEALLKSLQKIQVVKNPDDDGTAIGYAIFKTAHLIEATRHFAEDFKQNEKPPFTIKSAIIIVVTDGFQDPNHLDLGNRLRTLELDDAAAYAKAQGIKLYVINIDPALGSPQFNPQRRQLQAITALTGGQFYLVGDDQELQDIYASINQLEKGDITKEASLKSADSKDLFSRFSLYPFFIILGLLFLFIALILDCMILRRVP